MTIVETGRGSVQPNQAIGVTVDPAQVHLFDETSGVRI
jgi:multiple sugar transport system ATP-binding protein